MSSSVISVENLSKYYKLGLIGGGTLREDVSRWAAKLRGKPDPTIPVGAQDHHNRKGGEIWALRDINLEVSEGEILGIIGRNGAGKSTLLKILSRITAPTSGRAVIRGRVGSLLEVGTGFHPELTGRENIYLNGAILGMTKLEVDRKLEEIVAFAEMAKFVDTPVKRYSSGMTVRLAFAVAAHLEPEILIVDEVLAVGDLEFQAKCMRKMDAISGEGRTILFVSHNMGSINRLCSRAMLMNSGTTICEGKPDKVITEYYSSGSDERGKWDVEPGSKHRYLKTVTVEGEHTSGDGVVPFAHKTRIRIQYIAPGMTHSQLMIRVKLADLRGNHIFTTIDTDTLSNRVTQPDDICEELCEIPARMLRPGVYTAQIFWERIAVNTVAYFESAQVSFSVSDVGWGFESTRRGILTPLLQWKFSRLSRKK